MDRETETLELVYRIATHEEILGLREAIIIRGTDRSSPEFPGDHDPETLHMGVFVSGRNIGCLSLIRNQFDEEPAYQLRGMAVQTDYQGLGHGKSLLKFSEEWIVHHTKIRLLWCNARTSAASFYVKQGWKPVSGEFLIEGVGPHYRMIRRLAV